jgi:hypothetical protein
LKYINEVVEWDVAINYAEAIQYLMENSYDLITLDHDLGEIKTGYDVANWLENSIVNGNIIHSEIRCHSANPVGRLRINKVITSIERFRRL